MAHLLAVPATVLLTLLSRCTCARMQAPTIATGFRITVAKWLVLVRLLLGEVPERIEFTTPGLATALQPYFRLTLAVRGGDLSEFRCTCRLANIVLVRPFGRLPVCTGQSQQCLAGHMCWVFRRWRTRGRFKSEEQDA